MPWTAADATKHTKKADTKAKQQRWAKVANSCLADGDSEASAIRQANAVIAGHGKEVHSSKMTRVK